MSLNEGVPDVLAGGVWKWENGEPKGFESSPLWAGPSPALRPHSSHDPGLAGDSPFTKFSEHLLFTPGF